MVMLMVFPSSHRLSHPCICGAVSCCRMCDEELNPAAVAQPVEDVHGDGRWMAQHTRFVQECKDGEPDVLFVGDSMFQLMEQYEVWKEFFSPLHALNFSIAGDTTCNVLWRLQNGELENIGPKVVVLWVGTNNYEHTAEQVAGGILAIAQLLASHLPKAKIVVLGLLPRGEHPNPLRVKNAAVNGFLHSWLPRLGQTQLLDVGREFVHSDGTIIPRHMFDFLHLTSTGYLTVAKPLSDLLLQILDETPEERQASLV
ncbi:platelet-activating factor acetylhydrolase IB subunit beta isoform X1 [Solea solea]|uniref:platelet-activating factor acetylhydrolase IB subunit beta isoform X1 n=2 Tax=Solea solea TaxID=90069 RepID=UPI00272992A9|nr:platelet-activating factor acetylhydrolase IB subunit beta isoform X1 [Solea solea]